LAAVGIAGTPASTQKRPNIIMLMDPTNARRALGSRDRVGARSGTTSIAEAATDTAATESWRS